MISSNVNIGSIISRRKKSYEIIDISKCNNFTYFKLKNIDNENDTIIVGKNTLNNTFEIEKG